MRKNKTEPFPHKATEKEQNKTYDYFVERDKETYMAASEIAAIERAEEAMLETALKQYSIQ